MKIRIGQYEVTVSVRNTIRDEKANLLSTMAFMNEVAIAFSDAATYNKQRGYHGLANLNREWWLDIHNALEKAGAYKDC